MASANCKISPIFEYDVSPCPPMQAAQQTSPFGCCNVPCTEGNEGSCCPIEYEQETSESMWDCPEGFLPDWCARYDEMVAINPKVFGCIDSAQLEWLWREVQCILGNGCMCDRPMLEMLLLTHLAYLETKWQNAYDTALVAGSIRGTGGMKPMFGLSSGLGGATNLADSNFMLSQWGMRYLSQRELRKRNVTGAYAAVARNSTKLNLRAMTGVY